jgi:DNA-binding LacI/PurR family transcriptional regulator
VGIVVQLKTKSFSYDFAAANYAFSQRLFSTDILPDAIMCSNDQGAFGVFNAATERGLSIPRDLAVTGADDDEFGKYPMFGLTTIRSDVAQSCAAGVKLLKDRIQKKTSFRASKIFQSELVLRTSCGRSNPMGGEQVVTETRACGQDVIPF